MSGAFRYSISVGAVTAGAIALAVALPAHSASDALARVPVNQIWETPALKAQALNLGARVYKAQCAACHGADLKGSKALHAPDLTDDVWLYSGDDLDSGGLTMFPSDVEKTVLYGIRSGHAKARAEAVMPGLGPNDKKVLSDPEIADVVDYVMELGGVPAASAEAAARGKALFADKGNCFDCHLPEGIGNGAIGSTDLTKPALYLYGEDRESLLRTVREGVAGTMPAYEGKLSPAEIKAVSAFVFSKAAPPAD